MKILFLTKICTCVIILASFRYLQSYSFVTKRWNILKHFCNLKYRSLFQNILNNIKMFHLFTDSSCSLKKQKKAENYSNIFVNSTINWKNIFKKLKYYSTFSP